MQTSSVNNRMLHAANQTHSISQPCQYSHKTNTQVRTTKHGRLELQGNSNFQQMQMYKSTRMQAKQMKGALCSCTCAHKLLPYYTRARARACVRVCARARACVRLVNVCMCLRRRACVPVSDECAHVCALGKTHTHTHKKQQKTTTKNKKIQQNHK